MSFKTRKEIKIFKSLKAGALYPKQSYVHMDQETKDYILELHKEGHTARYIADEVGRAHSTVCAFIKKVTKENKKADEE